MVLTPWQDLKYYPPTMAARLFIRSVISWLLIAISATFAGALLAISYYSFALVVLNAYFYHLAFLGGSRNDLCRRMGGGAGNASNVFTILKPDLLGILVALVSIITIGNC